jgi:hypothetical protein
MRAALVALLLVLSTAAPADAAGTVHARSPWGPVAECESGRDWRANTGNGYYGGLQFSISTWNAVAHWRGADHLVGLRPDLAGPRAQRAQARTLAFSIPGGGLHHWPVCGAAFYAGCYQRPGGPLVCWQGQQ